MKSQLAIVHKDQGKFVDVAGKQGFVYEKGEGEPVICFHGVPASSFLYRKIIDGLSAQGLKGISFDLLGLGLSDRPTDFDYSWTGLGNWSSQLIQQLSLGRFHLVLHDIGGPIGCEVINKMKDQVLSVTILNTPLIHLEQFSQPFPMFIYAKKGFGELLVSLSSPLVFRQLMHMRGVHKNEVFGSEEAKAYVEFLLGDDRARSFLQIMRNFEPTSAKEKLYLDTLDQLDAPKQIIWGMNDPGLTFKKYGEPLRKALGLSEVIETQGSHFLQEDYPELVVENVVKLSKSRQG